MKRIKIKTGLVEKKKEKTNLYNLALGRLKQNNCLKFKTSLFNINKNYTSLSYIAMSCLKGRGKKVKKKEIKIRASAANKILSNC